MISASSFDKLASSIASLDESEVKTRLKSFTGLKLDFTDKYLDGQSTDKLRHILLAAMATRMRGIGI
ncbi:MAG: hypothetical protein IH624_09115 [Phycisphaerae bacterium]|nr:hypothetical protein [Phycisphaerae bacterium]